MVYGLLLVLALPLLLMVMCIIALIDGFPVIFRQKRVGKDGKVFTIYKFRTMRVGSEAKKQELKQKNEADGPVFKIYNDPRYTTIGHFLAHTGVDELPQLANVLLGDMVLIGPRPLPVEEAMQLRQTYQKRYSIKPGIISPAILTGRYHEDFDAWMKSDIEYAKRKSLAYDARLAVQAIWFLLRLVRNEIRN